MKTNQLKIFLIFALAFSVVSLACSGLIPVPTEEAHVDVEDAHKEEPQTMPSDNGFPDRPAIPNDSGIEGVETYADKSEYHNHVNSVPDPGYPVPPSFGQHLNAWQNCGIYDQPIGLGNALHSLEHGAVWLSYSSDVTDSQIAELQNIVRGHDYVLMSPYPSQTTPVVLSAWTVQLVIDSLPDDRIAAFIDYFEEGPQNPEPGAPCSGAIGNPLP